MYVGKEPWNSPSTYAYVHEMVDGTRKASERLTLEYLAGYLDGVLSETSASYKLENGIPLRFVESDLLRDLPEPLPWKDIRRLLVRSGLDTLFPNLME